MVRHRNIPRNRKKESTIQKKKKWNGKKHAQTTTISFCEKSNGSPEYIYPAKQGNFKKCGKVGHFVKICYTKEIEQANQEEVGEGKYEPIPLIQPTQQMKDLRKYPENLQEKTVKKAN